MGIYFQLYSILSDFLYGSGAELTTHMDFVLTELATLGCIAAVGVPFVLVGLCIKSIFEVL